MKEEVVAEEEEEKKKQNHNVFFSTVIIYGLYICIFTPVYKTWLADAVFHRNKTVREFLNFICTSTVNPGIIICSRRRM